MRTRRILFDVVLAATLAAATACAVSPGVQSRDLEQQVQQQDAQLRQLQPAQADMQNEVQSLRAEINTLRGQLDALQNAGGAQAIVERVNRQDAALRQIDDKMALNLDLGPQNQATAQTSTSGIPVAGATLGASGTVPSTGSALPTYGNPALAGAQAGGPAVPEGTLPYQGPAGQQQAQAPSGSTWGQESPRPTASTPAPQKDISLALFDAGVNAYNARNYVEAQRSFNDFVKNYPSHNLIPEARYYLAECYFQRNQFNDAVLAYDTVIKKYPTSSSAPGAYLKQGICFSKINQKAAATARMQDLIKKYPKSPEAARAKSFLQTNK
ncbi:MAG: tol-pal system protein YbgF [Desulfovibrio sp.]|jgi:tol-pal system protein YbgF|nr:tol-pal system protein YbgF [Desulfovibrio sp.]